MGEWEGATNILGQTFERQPTRYYQRPGRKHASGTSEWHGRKPYLRKVQAVIGGATPSAAGMRTLARQLAGLLEAQIKGGK